MRFEVVYHRSVVLESAYIVEASSQLEARKIAALLREENPSKEEVVKCSTQIEAFEHEEIAPPKNGQSTSPFVDPPERT